MRRLAGGRERGNARREEEGCSPSRERTRGASRREKRERERVAASIAKPTCATSAGLCYVRGRGSLKARELVEVVCNVGLLFRAVVGNWFRDSK